MWIVKLQTELNFHRFNKAIVLLLVLYAPFLQAMENSNPQLAADTLFASIDGQTISQAEFTGIFEAAVRHKYYHGRVPQEELEKFRKQVAEDIILQILLHREAKNLGLQPDRQKIRQGLDEYEHKVTNNIDWKSQQEKLRPLLLERLERQNLIEKIRARVQKINNPEADDVKQYYLKNPQKFTEPGRLWLSVILLEVPPAADKKMWQQANVAAQQFKQRIESGTDFAELAQQFSAHPSAVNGGDLGYLHQGMLDGDAQTAVNALKINQLTDPVLVLGGLTLFRLNGIQAERLKPFSEVAKRAEALLLRELKDIAWQSYTKTLIDSAKITLNENLYAFNDD